MTGRGTYQPDVAGNTMPGIKEILDKIYQEDEPYATGILDELKGQLLQLIKKPPTVEQWANLHNIYQEKVSHCADRIRSLPSGHERLERKLEEVLNMIQEIDEAVNEMDEDSDYQCSEGKWAPGKPPHSGTASWHPRIWRS